MKKISFKNDYAEGCHPRILEALLRTNLEQQNGYGSDAYCGQAERMIQEKVGNENAKVFFLSGGTQANLIVISALLRPYESVISVASGHILNNETGAIEATGHKIHSVVGKDGKVFPNDVEQVLQGHQNVPHQLKPKMVYISNATEVGTTYTRAELQNLSDCCKAHNLLLFMDGARLGHALTAATNDLSLRDVAQLTDVFYLGGTKNGAMFGEAVVITNAMLQPDFAFNIKQKGGLLAKGRFLGLQFSELLRDELYFDLARHANEQAMKIKAALKKKNYDFWTETFTNQLFPILPNAEIDRLAEHFEFYVWQKIDADRSAIRLITSWATTDEMTKRFIENI